MKNLRINKYLKSLVIVLLIMPMLVGLVACKSAPDYSAKVGTYKMTQQSAEFVIKTELDSYVKYTKDELKDLMEQAGLDPNNIEDFAKSLMN